jgi:hypothetical protein
MAPKTKQVIANQAQIDAARAANTAAAQQKAALEAKAAAAFEKGRPIITQALSGASTLTKALNAQILAAQNPGGIYDPIAGTFKSGAQLQKEASTLAKASTGQNRLGGLTTEQVELGKALGKEKTEAEAAAAAITFAPVPDPIYQTITDNTMTAEEIQALIDAALAKQREELLGEQKKLAEQQKKTALEEFKASLTTMGLADLTDTIDEFIKNDYTASQIKLELPKTEAYKIRFPGMQTLKDANRAINEATYIANERGYLQTLRAYGLDTATLGNRAALGTYISNEVSPREFEERVNLAATRVDENPEVLNAFKSYYPEADKGSVIAYLLNPKAGIDLVKKQVRVAEIGAAATAAGFEEDTMGINYSETLVPRTGEKTYNTIRTEFQRAKQLSDAQRRLAQIEGQDYSELEAISGVVGGEAESLLASQKRAQREVSRFSARGGVTGSSLASQVTI